MPENVKTVPSRITTVVVAALAVAGGSVPVQTQSDPGRARNLVGVVAQNTVSLSWQPPELPPQPVIGYVVEAGLSPGTTAFSLPVGNVLSLLGTAPDGIYYVRVQALTASGPTGPSNEVVLATGQAAPPLAPLTLTATVVGTTVTLLWTASPIGPPSAPINWRRATRRASRTSPWPRSRRVRAR